MSKHISTEKSGLRRDMRRRMREQTPAAHYEASRKIRDTLTSFLHMRACRVLCAFAPLPLEPGLREVLFAGDAVFELLLPRVCGDHLETFKVAGPGDLVPGTLGIAEPAPGCPRADPAHADVILVPGLAFDTRGGRLGRGKGYYDRFLAHLPGYRVGIAFDFQIVPKVPTRDHDVYLNALLSDRGVRQCRNPDLATG